MMQVHFSVGRYPVWRVRSAGSTSMPMLARCLVWRVGTTGFRSIPMLGGCPVRRVRITHSSFD